MKHTYSTQSEFTSYHFSQRKGNKGFTPLVEDDLVPKAFSLTTLFSVFNMFLPKSSSTNLRHKNARPSFTTGFTLVEIIISLAIFVVVAIVAVGALISIVDSNKKSQTSNTVITDLGFATESFSRDLRVGSAYHCTQNNSSDNLQNGKFLVPQACDVGNGEIIAFKSSKSDPNNHSCPLVFAYRFLWDTSEAPSRFRFDKAEQTECNGPLVFYPIVSDDIIITDYRLGVFYDPVNQPYPLAFIRLMGYVGSNDRDKTEFNLQTTVSQRILE